MNQPILTGTFPVRPFADRFVGTISGGHATCAVTVAALVCDDSGGVPLLSIVGPDTVCSAVVARLFAKDDLTFHPAEDIPWDGPTTVRRVTGEMARLQASLSGTREHHYLALARAADIRYLLQHPVVGPLPPVAGMTSAAASTACAAPAALPHYILGNAGETAPERHAFHAHLRALRVVHLPAWADPLWSHGLDAGLIMPLRASGMTAWQIASDRERWNALLTDGVRSGWLAISHATHDRAV